jgi:hypothetical protein
MQYSYSDTIPDKSVCENVPQDALIEIHVWEAFTVKRVVSYAGYLAEHSFDGTAVLHEHFPLSRVCYRFTQHEWVESIKPFLIQHAVPVSIRIVKSRFRGIPMEFSGSPSSTDERIEVTK